MYLVLVRRCQAPRPRNRAFCVCAFLHARAHRGRCGSLLAGGPPKHEERARGETRAERRPRQKAGGGKRCGELQRADRCQRRASVVPHVAEWGVTNSHFSC